MNLNTRFEFDGKLKTVLFAGMGLGVLGLLMSFIGDDQFHTRFWTNWLHNSLFFTGIALFMLFFLTAQITAFGGWNTVFKRVWEAMGEFLGIGAILIGVLTLGVWAHLHHLYHWNVPGVNDPASPEYDEIIAGKSGFLNPVFYTVSTIGFILLWYFWAKNLRKASIEQDTNETESFDYYKKQRKWSASALPIIGFLSPVFIWQVLMSIDTHWYSTMFAWYTSASLFLAGLSLTIMVIIFMKSQGYMEYVTREHLHDLGKYLFGISVFWTYLWFDQFMLIWYANNGEETVYFNERMTNYPVLFWGNLLLNFVTPFFILMRNDTKRKLGTMFFVSLVVFIGHWWDVFHMVKPGARLAAMHAEHGAHHSDASHHDDGHTKTLTAADMAHADDSHAHDAHGATGESDAHGQAAGSHAAAVETAVASAASHEGDGHGEDAHGAGAHGGKLPFKAGFTLPGFAEIFVFIGFLSLFLFFLFNKLTSASLVPLRDPFLEESLHHETGVFPEGEERGDDHH
ncbi:MAG: hypothetical protein ACK4NS_03515 [Saprospiraceae bacterium]